MLGKINSLVSQKCFEWVHGNFLVYNTCWEDPRLDRAALEFSKDDNVLVITSAGCNALDYAINGVKRVFAVDLNPRQNALLDLKLSGIRNLDYDSFFHLFGTGRIFEHADVYHRFLRADLSPISQQYWDTHIKYFAGQGWRNSFYFHGSTGFFAKLINFYIDSVAKVRPGIDELLSCQSILEQQQVYDKKIAPAFWGKSINWLMERDFILALLGVPLAQRRQIEKYYQGGVSGFVRDTLETVFCKLPIADNFFWRVYLTGEYTNTCCPAYLTPEGFIKLKSGAANKVTMVNGSIIDFLSTCDVKISKFVLLDHMDWLSNGKLDILAKEWELILANAAKGAKAIWRSGGLKTEYLDTLEVSHFGKKERLPNFLKLNHQTTEQLHKLDRVHTYGSFYLADLITN